MDTQLNVQTSVAPRQPVHIGSLVEQPISNGVAVLAGVAWLIFTVSALAVQPAPEPYAAPSLMGEVLSLLFTMSIVGAAIGLGLRRRWGLWVTIGGGATMMAAASFCFLTGHTGAWIAIQLVAGVGLTSTGWVLNKLT